MGSSFHCCSKCKGLFSTSDDHMKHHLVCSGNPFKSTSMLFACERKIYLQLFQTEDFQNEGSYNQLYLSKDDSFIDHVVKIRMPQELIDPSIFLRTNTSTNLHIPLLDSNILETDENLPGSKAQFSESIEPDQLRNIINKNIDFLKSDDIATLTSQTNKDLPFPESQSEPRLLSPIEKHFLPEGLKSRVQSPFEKCLNYLQDTGSGFQSASLPYASNQSIPFSCNLPTDQFGGLATAYDENLTSVDELPTLQYLDLAKKDIFFGQNPGLNQVNTKDPFLINATVKADRPVVPTAPKYPAQSSKSCEDLASPTLLLQDGNYFNFPSTLDEPTQLDYLDLATLDFLTNPNSFGNYGSSMFRDRFAEDRDDIYSECNFLFHEQNNFSSDNIDKSEKQSFEETVKLKKSKIKRISLKKVKQNIEKKNKATHNSNKKNDADTKEANTAVKELKLQSLTDSIAGRAIPDKKRFKRTYSADYDQLKPTALSRKRKLMSCTDTISFRISPEAKKKVKGDRRFNETQRLCPTNAILNVKDSLVGYSEEEKESMTAVIGCIIVKKQKSDGRTEGGPDQMITEVSTGPGDNKVFVLEGGTLQTFDDPTIASTANISVVDPTAVSGSCSENVKSVLKLKCQFCSFHTTSVTDFQNHRSEHENIADKPEQTDHGNENVYYGDMSQTSVPISENFVSNTSDDIEVLDNCAFSDNPYFFKEPPKCIQFNSTEITCSNVNENVDLNSKDVIKCLDERILELCEDIDTENVDSTCNLEPLSGQYLSDTLERTDAFHDDVPMDKSSPRQFKDDTVLVSHTNTAFSEAIMEESAQTTSNPVVQITFNSDSTNFYHCNTVTNNDASYKNPADQVQCNINVQCNLRTEFTPPTSDATFHETVQLGISENETSEPTREESSTAESIVEENVEDMESSSTCLAEEAIPNVIHETETMIVESPSPLQSEPFDSCDDKLTDETVEALKPPVCNSAEKTLLANKRDITMISEQTQTVSSYYINHPPTIYIFGQPNSPRRKPDANTKVDENIEEARDLRNVGTNTNTKQYHVNLEKSVKDVIMCNISNDSFVTCKVSGTENALDRSDIAPAKTDNETETSSKCDKTPSKSHTVNQNDNSKLSSNVSCDQACQAEFNLHGHTDRFYNEQIDIQTDDANAYETPHVNHSLTETSTELEDLSTVLSEGNISTQTVGSSNVAESATHNRETGAEETITASQQQIASHVTANIVDLDHSYTLGTSGKDTGPTPEVLPKQPISDNNTDEKFYMCNDCGFKTSRSGTMKAHTVKHKGVQLSCSAPDCDFKTVHKRCLNFHLLKHNSEYQLLCDQCAFTTTDSNSLRRHMQGKHYHQYRFKCPDCDQLSMFRDRITSHYRNTHLQEKLYACNQCDYRTGHSHLLKFHLMAHAGIRPYKCSACDYQVNNVNKVTRHIRTRHKGRTDVTCEKLDLNFEVDAKQFQCETRTQDKDIAVIELTDEQLAEIVDKRLAKEEKSHQDRLRPVIPVFDPLTMQPKRMVSLLTQIKSPEKQADDQVSTTNNLSRIRMLQIPLNQPKIVTRNRNVVVNNSNDLVLTKVESSMQLCCIDDSTFVKTKSGYKGVENIWTSIKPSQKTVSATHSNGESLVHNDNELEESLVHNDNDLDSEYQCSMCDCKLISHDDIARHLLACKMERNKSS